MCRCRSSAWKPAFLYWRHTWPVTVKLYMDEKVSVGICKVTRPILAIGRDISDGLLLKVEKCPMIDMVVAEQAVDELTGTYNGKRSIGRDSVCG